MPNVEDGYEYLYGSLTPLNKMVGSLSANSKHGSLEAANKLFGALANDTLRGEKIILDINGTVLRYRYENSSEWIDLIDFNKDVNWDYLNAINKPTIGDFEIEGDISDHIVLPEEGKGLSTNDFTDGYKAMLDNMAYIYSGTTDYWNGQLTLISEKDAIYVYTDQRTEVTPGGITINIPRIKIGDGLAFVVDLPFVDGGAVDVLLDHISANSIHVSPADRIRWDGKVSLIVEGENIVFSI